MDSIYLEYISLTGVEDASNKRIQINIYPSDLDTILKVIFAFYGYSLDFHVHDITCVIKDGDIS